MQEEVENKSVAISIKATKLTANVLKAALLKALEEMEKKQKNPKIYKGKQSVKHLVRQGAGVSNIEITDGNIKSFEKVARKYGIDFALKKDASTQSPRYLVFFKSKDADALTAAFREYSGKVVKSQSKEKPSIRKQLSKLQEVVKDLQNHDEKMFMVTILVVHAASSRQKLENLIYSANGITNTQNCDLIRLDYQQEQGFVSALPIGINQVEIQRGLTTSGTAIFLPFRACEVFQPKGVYYGLNATTNRMILADRKTLKCPNGVVLGTPGSGKSFSCKREAADVYLHTTDDLLFLDPENEYTSLCQQLSGQVIRLAPDSHDYINPLDVDLTTNTGENPLLMKADFIMSFCELILSAAQGGLKPIEKSVIDRCIPKIYRQLIKDPRPENMPILGDLYECLRAQQEEQAQELATALELYVFGSLNYLNHRTNVNVDNRVACYDISGLGQNLKKPGMLTVQNNIWQRTIVNRYAGKTTRIYLDEFHLLLKEPQTAAYTAEIYKRFRKWNGIPTSLTQNVKDLLESPEIENILENSDFILMLNQAASDRNILAQRLGISPQELGHITNSDAGEGLLFFGDKIIPFVDKFPTDTKLYQVMTTKPADLAA